MGRNREFDEKIALKKAMKLFWKQGYEKTSMNDLVNSMGIHRRSLYDTFGDKHTLFLKCLDYFGESIQMDLNLIISKAKTSKEAIQGIFDYMIQDREEECNLGCLFVNSASELAPSDSIVNEKVEQSFMRVEKRLFDIIETGKKSGEISTAYDSNILAENLHNTLIGIRLLKRTKVEKEKLYRIAQFSLELL